MSLCCRRLSSSDDNQVAEGKLICFFAGRIADNGIFFNVAIVSDTDGAP
jgi:hypothetical protein